MLEYAKKYEEHLVKLFYDVAFDPFYEFHQFGVYRSTFKIPDDTWSENSFVSTVGGNIIGYIGYSIHRSNYFVDSLNIIHFGGKDAKGGFVFGRDVMTALKDIFERYKFAKIKFHVVVGNPVEKTYDKLVKRYGGRIVGVYKNDVKLMDGNFYDVKLYEIFAEDYFASKNV